MIFVVNTSLSRCTVERCSHPVEPAERRSSTSLFQEVTAAPKKKTMTARTVGRSSAWTWHVAGVGCGARAIYSESKEEPMTVEVMGCAWFVDMWRCDFRWLCWTDVLM